MKSKVYKSNIKLQLSKKRHYSIIKKLTRFDISPVVASNMLFMKTFAVSCIYSMHILYICQETSSWLAIIVFQLLKACGLNVTFM